MKRQPLFLAPVLFLQWFCCRLPCSGDHRRQIAGLSGRGLVEFRP